MRAKTNIYSFLGPDFINSAPLKWISKSFQVHTRFHTQWIEQDSFCSRSFAVLKGSKNGQTYIVEEQNYTCVVPNLENFYSLMLKINKSLSQPNTITKKQSKNPLFFLQHNTVWPRRRGTTKKYSENMCACEVSRNFFSFVPSSWKPISYVCIFWRNIEFFFDLRLRLISSILAVHVQKPVYHPIGGESRTFEQ